MEDKNHNRRDHEDVVTPVAVHVLATDETNTKTNTGTTAGTSLPLAHAVVAPPDNDDLATNENHHHNHNKPKSPRRRRRTLWYWGVGGFLMVAAVVTVSVVCAEGFCSTTTGTTNNNSSTNHAPSHGPDDNDNDNDNNDEVFPPALCDNIPMCHNTVEHLRAVLSTKEEDADDSSSSVVTICENLDLHEEDAPLVVERSGVTLVGCCGDDDNDPDNPNNQQQCILRRTTSQTSGGQDRILIVTGSNVTLQNMVFQNGNGDSTDNNNNNQRREACGANLLIHNKNNNNINNNDISPSYFRITDCEFLGGRCGVAGAEGGNVYIETAAGGSVYLNRSKFINGVATFGGGVAIIDAATVVVDACEFTRNQGSGLAHFVWDYSDPAFMTPGQDIVIRDSTFHENQGDFGGAIFGSNFGTMPKLEVWNTQFTSNTCTGQACGGTASIIGSTGPVELHWDENTGEDDRSLDDATSTTSSTMLRFPKTTKTHHEDGNHPNTDNSNKRQQQQNNPMPTRAQQHYHDNEIAVMITFNMGTYFPYGFQDPACHYDNWEGLSGSGNAASFDPYLLDTDQWGQVFARLGAKHAVLTVKHGCGFLLWPTQVPLQTTSTNGSTTTTNYTYMVGVPGVSAVQEDVVQKFVNSMHKYHIGVGFYYSVKNNFYCNIKDHQYMNTTHHLLKGQVNVTLSDYETMALEHLKELWTNYGNLTEIWFDGGYANTTKQYLRKMLQAYQPDAIVWRGQGITPSTVAWVGTETGYPAGGDEIWSTGCSTLGGTGDPNSSQWCPKGCDTTLQNSDEWFYVPEDGIRSLETMVDIYHHTVGRNGVMELDVAVDTTGRIRYDHAQRYQEMGDYITACYGTPLQNWTQNLQGDVIEVTLDKPVLMDRIILREDQWRGGQRVRRYNVHVQLLANHNDKMWTIFSNGQSIGNKRIDFYNATSPNMPKPIWIHGRIRFQATSYTNLPMLREISIFAPCPHPANFTTATS